MAAIISVASCTAFTFGEAASSRRALYTSISCWPRWKPSAMSVYAAASSKVTVGAEGKADNKRPARGITKPKPVSPALQAFLGVKEIPRTQALKQIWAYIKEKNLQDPENKRIIICDAKLKSIFGGRDQVGFLEISGLLNPHFVK